MFSSAFGSITDVFCHAIDGDPYGGMSVTGLSCHDSADGVRVRVQLHECDVIDFGGVNIINVLRAAGYAAYQYDAAEFSWDEAFAEYPGLIEFLYNNYNGFVIFEQESDDLPF